MKKLFAWFSSYFLTIATILLIAFIPLYPKLPLLDIKNTWVYVRVEDFLVVFVLLVWAAGFVRNKVSIKTPLTIPILLFWLVGAVATLHSILFIVPTVFEIYPNVAFLSFLRRVEYMSLFFVAFSAVRDKRTLALASGTVVLTVLAASLYGIGQKYLAFPAYLTMNEEFAKGIPLTLSKLGRVSSTFGGHYDLAAYLVLTIPIVVSLMLSMRNWILKGILLIVSLLGAWVLFLTVSRISLLALVVALALVVFFQKRRLFLLSLPFAVLGLVLLVTQAPRVLDRFGSTVKEVDVIVDAKTGAPIGHVKEVPKEYFRNTTVRQYFYDSITDVIALASPSAKFTIPYETLGDSMTLLIEPTAPTGEDLPSGTGYVNLTLSPDIKRLGNFLYEPKTNTATTSAEAYIINGEYILKRAYAYDLSFTTRFQGEWPKTLAAFKRNIFIGSGYGSVSLAVDNSYLRMLGEVGGAGTLAFLAIFLSIGVFVVRAFPKIDSLVIKSVVWGYIGGLVGLMINAFFIDVFEASKVAFSLWLITGAVVGTIALYERSNFFALKELKRIVISPYAVIVALFLVAMVLYTPLTRNYFIGDDFTWFRWAAQGGSIGEYFTHTSGFFYRPGTKLYFFLMYRLFWLNQSTYHFVSLFLHALIGTLVFLLAGRVFKKFSLAALTALLFVVASGFSEAVFWVSATGHLIAAALMLLSMLLYGVWRERGTIRYFVGTIVSFGFALLFHEMAVVTPLLLLAYEWTLVKERNFRSFWLLLSPLPVYATLRLVSGSHWFSGDYSFNLLKLPFNAIGNVFGYAVLAIAGPFGLPLVQTIRSVMQHQLFIAGLVLGLGGWGVLRRVKTMRVKFVTEERSIVLFASLFTIVSLLPFLGLGNISPRYGYLSSAGMMMLFVYGLNKLHANLVHSGKAVATLALSVVVMTFVLMQSVGVDKLHRDWYEAGEMVRKFFITMDARFQDYWMSEPMEFYFVNVPIRHRDAWVFPVGMSDALWFSFRNPTLRVFTMPSVESALDAVTYGSTLQKVFVFDSNGSVKEVEKPPSRLP